MKFGQLIEYNVKNVKNMQKMRLGDQFQTSFWFLEKLYIKSKQVVSTLVLSYFGRTPLGH